MYRYIDVEKIYRYMNIDIHIDILGGKGVVTTDRYNGWILFITDGL